MLIVSCDSALTISTQEDIPIFSEGNDLPKVTLGASGSHDSRCVLEYI